MVIKSINTRKALSHGHMEDEPGGMKNSSVNVGDVRQVRRSSRRHNSTLTVLHGESRGLRSLEGYGP